MAVVKRREELYVVHYSQKLTTFWLKLTTFVPSCERFPCTKRFSFISATNRKTTLSVPFGSPALCDFEQEPAVWRMNAQAPKKCPQWPFLKTYLAEAFLLAMHSWREDKHPTAGINVARCGITQYQKT